MLRFLLPLLLALPVCATPPAAPGEPLVSGGNDATWQPLFAALAAQTPVFAPFTEQRWFPFRKVPTVLRGEMRLDATQGLSLRYVEPEERLMIIDAEGLLLRDAAGRTRAVPADPHAPAMNTVLLPVLRFDLAALAPLFEVRAARDGDDWRLDFLPRDEALARSLTALVVTGTAHTVTRVEFRRSAAQRVEILLGPARTGQAFDADELRRFFR